MTQRQNLDRMQWRKSSYSTGSGSNCIEVGWPGGSGSRGKPRDGWCSTSAPKSVADVAEDWCKKSGKPDTGGGHGTSRRRKVGVRDTKNRTAGALTVSSLAWKLFVDFTRRP